MLAMVLGCPGRPLQPQERAVPEPGPQQVLVRVAACGVCQLLDAAIIFAPVGALVPQSLAAVGKGGTVVCAGIHMSDIPSFPYRLLWEERVVRSVANLTRADGEAFMALAGRVCIRTTTEPHPLTRANEALAALREGRVTGAAVLQCSVHV